MRGELNRTVLVYVDSVSDGIPSGRFHIASKQEAKPFHGFCQLLIAVNQQLDRENFPQAFEELRKFHIPTAPDKNSLTRTNQKNGALATLSIRILFRQNASWQGSILWQEGNQEIFFRSVLELLVLMDNVLSCIGGQ